MQVLQRSFDDVINAGTDEGRLIKTMSAFTNILTTASVYDKYVLKMKDRKRILDFHETLRSLYPNGRGAVMSARERSFAKLLNITINNFPAFLEHQTTTIFGRFMKGITYFNNTPILGSPIYHRLSSCGPNPTPDSYVTANLDCLGENYQIGDTEDLIRRRQNIKNCIIERIVYDRLYTNITTKNQQDFGHIIQLIQKMRMNFSRCFTGTADVEVEVFYHPQYDFIPIKTVITIPSTNKEVIEEYIRSIDALPSIENNQLTYNPTIRLRRILRDFENHVEIVEEKEQTENGTFRSMSSNTTLMTGGRKNKPKYILYENKKYLVRTDKKNNRYIVSKHKILLTQIAGKYRYY